ncbi:hypothetical protein GGR53DRAFT_524168 [Hypoxylon sp. FL1150]|nr:hypothetical protein GGR53DRAFT_524168 [Hypoxylon sp. FL1150]
MVSHSNSEASSSRSQSVHFTPSSASTTHVFSASSSSSSTPASRRLSEIRHRPAPKRRNLFGTGSGDATPTSTTTSTSASTSFSQRGTGTGTGSTTPPTPASVGRGRSGYAFYPSRASSSRTFSPEKREVPAPATSRSTAAVAEAPKYYIDPDGDLCLEVGFAAAKFVVDSKVLARASPVWKKLLDTESRKTEAAAQTTPRGRKPERVLKLPDDNNSAMEIFLNIVHGRFDRVSGFDDFVYLVYFYSLCVLTHKYDVTRVLRPWAKGWSRTVHANCDRLGESLRTRFCHERLWIAWELGDQPTFEAIAKTLLLESSAEPGYNLKYVGAVEPPEIYANIKDTRLYIISSLLSAARKIIEGLIQNSEAPAQCPDGKPDCVPSMLGNAIRSLHGADLWPLPLPEDVQCSVSTLAKNLRLAAFGDAASSPATTPSHTHTHTCSQRFERVLGEMIDVILNDLPSMLTKAHHVHLADRAEKAGFVQTMAAKP